MVAEPGRSVAHLFFDEDVDARLAGYPQYQALSGDSCGLGHDRSNTWGNYRFDWELNDRCLATADGDAVEYFLSG